MQGWIRAPAQSGTNDRASFKFYTAGTAHAIPPGLLQSSRYNVSVQFDWDAANVSHIEQHGVSSEEVEQAFKAPLLHGAADVSRRRRRLRVVTARDASRKERKLYAEHQETS